jgi:hypothetical protein
MAKQKPVETNLKLEDLEEPKLTLKPSTMKKAFTVERVPGGWSFVTFGYDDMQKGKMVEVERSQPDMKAMTIEKLKINLFKYWSNIG